MDGDAAVNGLLFSAPPPFGEDALEGKTAAELRALAKDAGIPGYSAMTKNQLLAALGDSRAEVKEDQDGTAIH